MPHISVKCYPKHLTKKEMEAFVEDLTHVAEKHLKATEDFVSISYQEIPAEQWKDEVYDKEIRLNMDQLAKKPGYEM